MSYERANVRRMVGYAYGEQPEDPQVAKLNTNENPYPPSPRVAKALSAFDVDALRRYPPATAAPLRRAMAARCGASERQVVVTNGGDEGLRLAVATFVDPGAALGLADPGYSLYPVLAAAQDCRIAWAPLDAAWLPPADCAARWNEAGAQLVCLANPHAPSGALLDAEAISRIAAALDGVLLVDEAYVDFVAPDRRHDLAALLARHDNLLLLRTLSKGYALAGLRVGFLLGDAALVAPILTKTRDSYNVDALAQRLAVAALEDGEYAADGWRRVLAERGRLTRALRARGFRVADSEANFVLATPPPGQCAATLQRRLRERGVLVRHFDHPRLRDCLRITVGAPAQNRALLAALDALASPQA